MKNAREENELEFIAGGATLRGDLTFPAEESGVVIFAHGSGSGRKSSRNRFVARVLNEAGVGTFLFDLLTLAEEREDAYTGHLRFNIPFLAERLSAVTDWLRKREGSVPVGYFGASTGAAAALIAATKQPVGAVVSRGGRPDLADEFLPRVAAPTLLIVGGNDGPVVGMNERAFARLGCEKRLEIVPGATHLFEEPGALETVARLAANWFVKHLRG
jgi:putative phosphoribosyl transferase